MMQVDVERGQEFRKCIECFMCQDVCHVIRDHEENKAHFAGPRMFIRYMELESHPLDTNDRRELLRQRMGLGMCNITKCCTEVCPEHIKITDNAIIPLKERVVDSSYDPVAWLGRKILRRTKRTAAAAAADAPAFAAPTRPTIRPTTGRGRDGDDADLTGTPSSGVLRFLSAAWVAAFDDAVADVHLAAVSADDGLAVRDGVFATSVMAGTGSGETVAVTVTVADGRLTMRTGAATDAGATVRLPWRQAVAFMAGTWSPSTALPTGRAQVRGDVAVLEATGLALAAVQSHVRVLEENTEYPGLGHDTSQGPE